MMVIGPLAGAAAGTLGGAVVADHRRTVRSDRGLPAVIAGEALPD
jgi:hypothetical protein